MAQPAPRTRRSGRGILIVLLLLAALGTGLWWVFFRGPEASSLPSLPAKPSKRQAPDLPKLFEDERTLMGTRFRIVAYSSDETAARKAIETAFKRGEEIGSICSDHDPASEVSKLNNSDQDELVAISSTLAEVLAHAHETADVTSGLYDPTLGTLTTLWLQSRISKKLPPRTSSRPPSKPPAGNTSRSISPTAPPPSGKPA